MSLLFEVELADGWDTHYAKLDKSEQERIWKKILQLVGPIKARHPRFGLPFFVVETGQYRICFEEIDRRRKIHFAGNHKQYERWYREQEF